MEKRRRGAQQEEMGETKQHEMMVVVGQDDGTDVEEQKAEVQEQEDKTEGQQPVVILQEQQERGKPAEAQAPPLPLPAPSPQQEHAQEQQLKAPPPPPTSPLPWLALPPPHPPPHQKHQQRQQLPTLRQQSVTLYHAAREMGSTTPDPRCGDVERGRIQGGTTGPEQQQQQQQQDSDWEKERSGVGVVFDFFVSWREEPAGRREAKPKRGREGERFKKTRRLPDRASCSKKARIRLMFCSILIFLHC